MDPPRDRKIPVAFRLDPSRKMREHLEAVSFCGPVIFMGSVNRSCSLQQIISAAQENDVRRYNATYSLLCSSLFGSGSQDPDTLWNSTLHFQRISNQALYDHQPVKKAGPAATATSWALFLQQEAMASALGGLDLSAWLISRKEDGSLRFPDLVEIAKTEHRRFCYNFAARGWGLQPMKGDTRLPKDWVTRLHDCLLPWDRLVREQPGKLVFDLLSAPYLMNFSRRRIHHLKNSAKNARKQLNSKKTPSNL